MKAEFSDSPAWCFSKCALNIHVCIDEQTQTGTQLNVRRQRQMFLISSCNFWFSCTGHAEWLTPNSLLKESAVLCVIFLIFSKQL